MVQIRKLLRVRKRLLRVFQEQQLCPRSVPSKPGPLVTLFRKENKARVEGSAFFLCVQHLWGWSLIVYIWSLLCCSLRRICHSQDILLFPVSCNWWNSFSAELCPHVRLWGLGPTSECKWFLCFHLWINASKREKSSVFKMMLLKRCATFFSSSIA